MAKKKKDEPEGHFGDALLDDLHERLQGTTENGACLVFHGSATFIEFRNKFTCNYRYQGYEQAKSHTAIKNTLHGYMTGIEHERSKAIKDRGHIVTSAYETDSGGMKPGAYCIDLNFPNKGDWDVGGPDRDITRLKYNGRSTTTIKKGHNFTRETWPYWNNAHHLISKGTFKNMILNEGPKISNIIQKALLTAKYNIHHKKNVLLMPQDKEVAQILGLPRHLVLKEEDQQEVSKQCTSHPIYDRLVRETKKGLRDILGEYRKICDPVKDYPDGHPIPDVNLDKSKLEKLSEKLLRLILGMSPGAPLDQQAHRRMSGS
ncbi:AHH domain-containing protein [Hahella sp. CR1]|uniref:AHH domain-containing protein n=1 Tax=Hahella sp. CR1 TaxID=2992807 RepID=UPI00244214F8|nr:AHH domain-containing protein [Hahella sp. CR1]MDG9669604.1 AHH domain-containing protein [Hahella sp. CR1]